MFFLSVAHLLHQFVAFRANDAGVRVAAAVLLLLLAACDGSTPRISEVPMQEEVRAGTAVAPQGIVLRVHKSPACGCCEDWMTHVQGAGFTTQMEHPVDLHAIKSQYGIAPHLQSCHTAVSPQGYVFEGHVPARFVRQFLDNPPANAIGLAVPGMPLGSPGMEAEDRFTPYQVLLLKSDGSTEVYARVDEAAQQYPEDAQP